MRDRRERCKWCGRIYGLAWTVPDEVWVQVMSKTHKTACLDCFDAIAVQKGVDYVGALTLHGYASLSDALRYDQGGEELRVPRSIGEPPARRAVRAGGGVG